MYLEILKLKQVYELWESEADEKCSSGKAATEITSATKAISTVKAKNTDVSNAENDDLTSVKTKNEFFNEDTHEELSKKNEEEDPSIF